MRISDWSSDVCSSDLCKVGAFKRFTEFAIGNAIAGKTGRVGLDDERLGVAADRIDPGNTADRLQLRAHDPVLDRAQIAGLRDLVREDRKSTRLNSSH